MSGVTPLVDTLLATRLASRPDLVPLKGQVEIAGPGAVTHAEKTVNDVRLPSRAALEQQLGVALPGRGDGHPALRTAGPEQGVTLSATARAIAAILGDPVGPGFQIKGVAPLWTHRRAPAATLLASQLMQTVAVSGLFYESHLAQHAAGLRTLAELSREPQAGLAPLNGKAAPAQAGAEAVLPVRPGNAAAVSPLPQPAVPAGGSEAAPLSTVYGRAGALESARASWHGVAGQDPEAQTLSAPSGASGGSNAVTTAAVHPEAMSLVRLQLELLTVPVFRWVGEAWPNAAMDWRIYEEPQGESQTAPDDGEAAPAAWTTRIAITLPSLKSIDVRLTLAGTGFQVQLASKEDATLAVLEEGRRALSERFDAAGLQLTSFQIVADVAGNAAGGAPKDGHA
jgi:hypothetical protein